MEELQPIRWKMVAWDENRRDRYMEQIQNALEIKMIGLANGLYVEHKGKREIWGHLCLELGQPVGERPLCQWVLDRGGVGAGRLQPVTPPEQTMS